MRVKYEIKVAEKYTKNGEEKTYWRLIGRVLEGDRGSKVKIDVWPIGWDGWAYLYEPEPRDRQSGAPAPKSAPEPKAAAQEEFNDDIPF